MNNWILTSDRLPPLGSEVIVTFEIKFHISDLQREIVERKVTSLYQMGERGWDDGTNNGFSYPVIAWQYFPPPFEL